VVPAGVAACLLIGVVVYFMMRSEASANQSTVRSVDELIKSGENEKALDILQKWKAARIETASDMEKMDKLILKLAAESKNDPDEGITLLSELSPHSSHKKEAAELLKQLKLQPKPAQ
jgi:hypothetical protein